MDEFRHPCDILTAQSKVLDGIWQLRQKPEGHRTTYSFDNSYEAHLAYQMWQEFGGEFNVHPMEKLGDAEYLLTVEK